MSSPRVLITGCGRSGTAFSAKVLATGGAPVTHEGVFGPIANSWPVTHRTRIESSWLAAPHLANLEQVKVIHQVRNPLFVVRSFVGFGFFTRSPDDPYLCYVLEHAPTVASWDNPVDQAIEYWLVWNRMVEPHAERRVRLEDLSAEHFAELASMAGLDAADYSPAMASLGRRYNGRRRELALTRADLLGRPRGEELAALAERYGYVLKS